MDRTRANSAAKLGTRVVLPNQFEVLLDHCRLPTKGHPASLQRQLQDDATTAQSLYRHLHEAPDLLGVGGLPVLGKSLAGSSVYAQVRCHMPITVNDCQSRRTRSPTTCHLN